MKKEEIRKEFFRLRVRHHSYNQCKKIIQAQLDYRVTLRTLYRWDKKLNEGNWDLSDESRSPKIIHRKISQVSEEKSIRIRNKTGWGQERIADYVDVSHWSVNKILNKHNLTSQLKRKKKRNKYVRFEREHPNTMWQIDHSDQKVKDKWLISVIDDHSRYSLGLFAVNMVTTSVVTKLLDDLIKLNGAPRQILSDNGSAY